MAAQFASFRRNVEITLGALSGPAPGMVVPIRIDDPSIVAVLNGQGEGRALAFTDASSSTQLPHHLVRADFPATRDGCWSWYSRPEAVHALGITYWFPVTQYGELIAPWYRHSDGARGQELLETFTTGTGGGVDDHNNGAGLVLASGKVLACYSDHNGTILKCRKQTTAGDPTAWDPAVSIDGVSASSYVLPVQLSGVAGDDGGKIILFARQATGSDYRRYYYVSTDAGATWSAPVAIFQSPDNAFRQSTIRRPYMHVAASATRVYFLLSDGNPPEVTSPVTGEPVNSLYVCYYDATTGNVHQMDGTVIDSFDSPPAGGIDTFDVNPVFLSDGSSSGQSNYWNWDIQLDADGNPCVVGLRFTGSPNPYEAAEVVYARWNGSAWVYGSVSGLPGDSTPIANTGTEPYYHGGAVLDPRNPTGRMLVSWPNPDAPGVAWDVWEVTSGDQGVAWTPGRRLNTRRGNERKAIRPVFPRHYDDGLWALWPEGHYGGYQMVTSDNGVGGFNHDGFATGIQTYPRIAEEDYYVAYVRVDLGTSPTVIVLHYDDPTAQEQADKASTFPGFLYVSNDVHVHRWKCGQVNMANLGAHSQGFVGRWGRTAFDAARQHHFLSNWDLSGANAHVLMREQSASGSNIAVLYRTTSGSFGNAPWSASPAPQSWFSAISTRNKAVSSGQLLPYLDGVALTPISPASAADMPATNAANPLWLGCTPHQNVASIYWNGEIGMAFIAPEQLSALWVQVFSENPFDPSWNFGTFGEVEVVDPNPPTTVKKSGLLFF